jgi:hypothetical protein
MMAKRFKQIRDSGNEWESAKLEDRRREKDKKRTRSETRKHKLSEKHKLIS